MISLTFGLASTGALLLAVATDYWLYTSEPMDFENMVMEVRIKFSVFTKVENLVFLNNCNLPAICKR